MNDIAHQHFRVCIFLTKNNGPKKNPKYQASPPQIRRLYAVKQLFSLPFDLHCKAIAALFFRPESGPIRGHCPLSSIHPLNVSFFSQCSVTCGGGVRVRSVTCRNTNNQVVPNTNCPGAMPDIEQVCSTNPCATYVVGEWSDVSGLCFFIRFIISK